MDFYFQPNGQPAMGNGQMVSGHSGHTLHMPQEQQHPSTMHPHQMLDAHGNPIIPAVVSPPNNFDSLDCSPDGLDCQIKDEQFGFSNPHQQFDMNMVPEQPADETMQADALDDDLTTKRKAQNRAAQRAFRERREQRLKELEDKVAEVEQERERLAAENERLQRENTVITTENKVLMETAVSKGPASSPDPTLPPTGKAHFPYKQLQEMRAKTQDTLLGGHEPPGDKNLKIIYQSEASHETMLGAAAVWDTIAKHAEEEEFDIDLVARLIQGHQRCEGFGPVFPLRVVEDAIKEAIRQYV
ncbi:hypothetical protein CJU89_4762 [Yarrowia sp. B02]|nr:hypothetical protein CJU89_4762 [Yarrowia sp. B02]